MRMKALNNQNSQCRQGSNYLGEGLRFKDMVGLVKPEIHIDEFSAKMGDDDDIIVISFYVKDKAAAEDLVNWFEKGYEFVLDADRSPGELKPNRYLVYIELKRRANVFKKLAELLEDMESILDYTPADWVVKYKETETKFNIEALESVVPLSPREYRAASEKALNEYRQIAGLPYKSSYNKDDKDICALLRAAGRY